MTPTVEFIEANIERIPFSGCWIWVGRVKEATRPGYAYGRIRTLGRDCMAHRIAFELIRGPIPSGLFACHSCDVPECVNPWHIFLGTQTDNMRDMAKKGRSTFGEKSASAKINPQIVLQIRQSPLSQRAAAKQFGISKSQVHQIRSRATWKHV